VRMASASANTAMSARIRLDMAGTPNAAVRR